MQIVNPIHHRIPEYKLHAQSLRLWVLQLLAWVAGWAGKVIDRRDDELLRAAQLWLRAEMAVARKQIKEILFLLVMAHLNWSKRGKRPTTRPRNVAVGFRRVARRIEIYRIFLRGVRLKTLDDMRSALDNLDRTVERAVKRVPKKSVAMYRIAPVAPPATAVTCLAPAPAPAAADTS